MRDAISAGFRPTAFDGPAWKVAREQLAQPHAQNAGVEGLLAGMELRDLHSRYAYTTDQGDLDRLLGFFTDDCVIDSPQGNVVGIAAIRDHYARVLRETTHRFHVFTNMVVRLAEDFQSGRIVSYYLAVLQNDGEPPRTVGGLLADDAVKQDGIWKVHARSVAHDVTI